MEIGSKSQEDPLSQQPRSAEGGSALSIVYPACKESCNAHLRASNGDCVYHQLRMGIASGKKGVRTVLERLNKPAFASMLERGSDAPCITEPKYRQLIDSQINAEQHDRDRKPISAERARALWERELHG